MTGYKSLGALLLAAASAVGCANVPEPAPQKKNALPEIVTDEKTGCRYIKEADEKPNRSKQCLPTGPFSTTPKVE